MVFVAENAENHEDIEKLWAVTAFHHAETFMKLVKAKVKVRLTENDDNIYTHFRREFSTLNISVINEENDFKSESAKSAWRNFIKEYEQMENFNYGTLLRIDGSKDYSGENSMFVTRCQFWAIEIARMREGVNDDIVFEE